MLSKHVYTNETLLNQLEEFEVTTNRVGQNSPVAHENISKEKLKNK